MSLSLQRGYYGLLFVFPVIVALVRNSVYGFQTRTSSALLWKNSNQYLSRRRHRTFLSSTGSPNDDKNDSSTATSTGGRLSNCICLVTGASRGIGKGIALELGAAGATVYVTGTSSSSSSSSSTTKAGASTTTNTVDPGTVEETAQEITNMGGHGIAVVCNHEVDDDVKRLMDQIDAEHGRLDILVNNAFRLPPGGVENLYGNFWEQGTEVWDTLHNVGLRSHFIATCFAMPLLQKARDFNRKQQPSNTLLPRPFIAMISSFGGITYTFNVPYGVQKAAVDRLAKDMAVELTPQDICVVSLWPGLVDTERTQLSVANGDWEKYVRLPLDNAETPRFTGRAVVALATDADNLAKKSGTYQVVAELAQEYGFTDVDGTKPPSIRSLRFLLPTYGMDAKLRDQIPPSLIPDWKLPFWIMAQGAPPASEE